MSPKQKRLLRAPFRVYPVRVHKVRFPKPLRSRSRASEAAYRHHGPRDFCAYCGEPAECVDHAVPASYAMGATELIASSILVKVASCKDCNHKAGNVVDATFAERRARIYDALRKASRRMLSIAPMDDDEFDDLGPGMQEHVLQKERETERVRRRLVVLSSADRPEGIPADLIIAA